MIYVHVLGAQSRIKEVKRYQKSAAFLFLFTFRTKHGATAALFSTARNQNVCCGVNVLS